jgi:hypothetical protein
MPQPTKTKIKQAISIKSAVQVAFLIVAAAVVIGSFLMAIIKGLR